MGEAEIIKMDISNIVEGDFYKETLVELRIEKQNQINKIKIEAFTKRKEIVKIKVESDLYKEIYEINGEKAFLYLKKHEILKEASKKLNDEFNADNNYNTKIFKLNSEIEAIDSIIRRCS